ncbi:MAG: hypothetical protein AAF436_19145 [Myxococcota bacterium]
MTGQLNRLMVALAVAMSMPLQSCSPSDPKEMSPDDYVTAYRKVTCTDRDPRTGNCISAVCEEDTESDCQDPAFECIDFGWWWTGSKKKGTCTMTADV